MKSNRESKLKNVRKVILGMFIILSAAGQQTAWSQERLVGASVALTGPYAFAGVPSHEGMQIAVDVVNASKMLGNAKLVVRYEDSASVRAQALTSVTRFASNPGTLMMIGPTASPEALAVAPVANELKFPNLSATVTAPDVLKPGPWTFKTVENPEGPINFVTDYALKNYRPRRVALVFASDNDGQILQKDVAKRRYQAAGVEVVGEIGVRVSDVDFSVLATRLVASKPDLIFLTLVPEQGANFISQVRQSGLDKSARVLGTESMSSERFIQMGGPAVEGVTFYAGWYSEATTPGNKAFVDEYRRRFGKGANVFAAQGYASVLIAASAIKAAGDNVSRESLRAALAATKDIPVPLGEGTISFVGDRVPRDGAVMLTVRDGKFVLVQ